MDSRTPHTRGWANRPQVDGGGAAVGDEGGGGGDGGGDRLRGEGAVGEKAGGGGREPVAGAAGVAAGGGGGGHDHGGAGALDQQCAPGAEGDCDPGGNPPLGQLPGPGRHRGQVIAVDLGDEAGRLGAVRGGQASPRDGRRAARMGVPDQRPPAGQAGQGGPHARLGGHAPPVVGHQHRPGPGQGAPAGRAERADPARPGGPVEPQQRVPVGPHPDLLRCPPGQLQVDHLDPGQLQQLPQGHPRLVAGQGRDQDHRPAVEPRGQGRGQRRPSRPAPLGRVVDHRHGRVGSQPPGPSLQVPVEQGVADDDQRRPGHLGILERPGSDPAPN